ncbi:MAG: sigma-54 dependent transcriptional regulator [Pirellulales bacterium]
MRDLRGRVKQIARTDETVLIVGESGTGKEMVARALHAQSDRAASPLIGLNCPVLSAQLMESELFGHEKGSFTGAEAQRSGRFELAHGGTILLDEISEIELSLQAKLLRVLQEKCFERVGSSKTVRVDARVIATSNRNLREEAAKGRFREDLYYRLAVVPLQLPSLRERRDDLPELTTHFLNRAAARLHREPCVLEDSAVELLMRYDWPGNVRELENIMTRASVLSLGNRIDRELLQDWLPAERLSGSTSTSAASSMSSSTIDHHVESGDNSVSMQEMERRLIESTLERFDGHRAKTAAALGIGVRTLSGKLKLYGYTPRAKGPLKIAG